MNLSILCWSRNVLHAALVLICLFLGMAATAQTNWKHEGAGKFNRG